MKIVALVLNSVRHDRRVLTEAESLARQGHEVTIIGIHDSTLKPSSEYTEGKVHILRIHWRSKVELLRFFGWGFLALSLFIALIQIFKLTFPPPGNQIMSVIHPFFNHLSVLFKIHPDNGLLFCGLAVFFTVSLYHLRSSYRYYIRYKAIENESIFQSPPHVFKRSISSMYRLVSREIRLKIVGRQFLKELKRINPHIVHCHDLTTLPIGVRYKQTSRCLLVYDSHELYEDSAFIDPTQKFYLQHLQKKYSQWVDGFITVNDSIGHLMEKRYPRLPKARIVKNAFTSNEKTHFKNYDYDGRLHKTAGLETHQKILLYHGGFTPFRGLEKLVQAAILLPYEWTLVLMGWGKLEKKLRKLAETLDPEATKIRFIPPVPPNELLKWVRGASLGIIPYENNCLNHWFCTPNKLWEFPAAGVPLLVSPFPELEKMITQWHIGWMLKTPVTAWSIADQIRQIRDHDLSVKRENCNLFFSQENWSKYERILLNLYRNISSLHSEASRN